MFGLFIAAHSVHALVCARFFFITSIVPDGAVTACLILAFVAASGDHRSRGR